MVLGFIAFSFQRSAISKKKSGARRHPCGTRSRRSVLLISTGQGINQKSKAIMSVVHCHLFVATTKLRLRAEGFDVQDGGSVKHIQALDRYDGVINVDDGQD